MLDEIFEDLKDRMGKSIESLKREYSRLRTGRASISLLDGIRVSYYDTPTPLNQMASLAVPEPRLIVIQRPNSRAAESEADRIGIELAAKAGYDPRAAITLWQKMAQAGGKGPPEFLSTHPSPENRQKKLAEYVPEMMPYYEQKGDRPIYKL
ncbi:unnamed protein product [marine sediment metagenome]|uniref:Ribosome recycling factor domain-containing protein n=1 Tax=marine sediment metagenome TaxID=412755 RepID=X1BGU1_9ZZZZ